MTKKVIADDNEILKLYTNVIRDGEESTTSKLKASELLTKLKDKGGKKDDTRVCIVDDIPEGLDKSPFE